MSEELRNPLSNAHNDETSISSTKEQEKMISRREALLGALFGVGVVAAKTASAAEACSCLAPPDCSSICTNGGTPKGDGTQACDCNPTGYAQVAYSGKYSDLSGTPTIPTLKTVAYTGSYNDLTDKPTTKLSSIVTAGSAGPTSNSTFTTTQLSNSLGWPSFSGSFNVPYFSVDAKGRIISYGTKTVTFSTSSYYNYYNYYNYYDSQCSDGE